MQTENTIQGLENHLIASYSLCHTAHERIMCKTIAGKEIRELAEKTARRRALSSQEISIAKQYGYKF